MAQCRLTLAHGFAGYSGSKWALPSCLRSANLGWVDSSACAVFPGPNAAGLLGANPRAASPVGDPDRRTRIYFPPSAKRNAPPLGFQCLKGNRRPDAHPLRPNPGPAFPVWWGSRLKLCSWQLCQSVSCWPRDAHVEMHKRNTQSHSQPGTMMSALHTSPRLTLTSQIPRPPLRSAIQQPSGGSQIWSKATVSSKASPSSGPVAWTQHWLSFLERALQRLLLEAQ